MVYLRLLADAMAVYHVHGCCGMHDSIPFGQDVTYSWVTASCCNICKRRGYICIAGCCLRKALDSDVKLKHHNYRMHQTTQASNLDHTHFHV
jgi:hypothetical protein